MLLCVLFNLHKKTLLLVKKSKAKILIFFTKSIIIINVDKIFSQKVKKEVT